MSLAARLRERGWLSDSFGKWRFLYAECRCGAKQILALPEKSAPPTCVQCTAPLSPRRG